MKFFKKQKTSFKVVMRSTTNALQLTQKPDKIPMTSGCDQYVGKNCWIKCCDNRGYCAAFHSECVYFYSDYVKPGPDPTTTLSTGSIVAIVVCVVIFITAAGLAYYCFVKKRIVDQLLNPDGTAVILHDTATAGVNQTTVVIPQKTTPIYPVTYPQENTGTLGYGTYPENTVQYGGSGQGTVYPQQQVM